MTTAPVLYEGRMAEIHAMATAVVKSRLFPNVATVEAAITLMLVCDAEGIHPMMALRRYDIIQGRPAMKTDAMLAEFQKRGGKVTWLQMDSECCEAEFMANGLGKPVRIKVDTEDAKRAGLLDKDNWRKYPRQMRRARVISEGIRAADPGVNAGVYTPEEVQDFDTPQDRPLSSKMERGIAYLESGAKTAPEPPAEPVEAFSGEPVDDERPAIFEIPPEPASVGFDAAFDQHLNERGLGQTCTKAGCGGVVRSYTASDDNGAKAGHVYLQCDKANALKNDARKAGVAKAKIREFVAGHSFTWA